MRFYRIEDNEGYGVYYSNINPSCSFDMQDTSRHPRPEDDCKLRDFYNNNFRTEIHHFGFASLEQLKSWVYKQQWRDELHDRGFAIAIIEADGVYGDTQAIFDTSTRQTIGTIYLNALD